MLLNIGHIMSRQSFVQQRGSSQYPRIGCSRLSNIDNSTPLIAIIVELLLQLLKVLSLSSTSVQVKSLPMDLNYLCTEVLSAQDAQLHSQIRFYDPDTPWIEQPNIARTLHTLLSALYAAHSGLMGSVDMLLARGMNVNATGGRFGSVLQAAACKGYTEVVEVLLAKGADVNLAGGDYGDPLQGACSYGHRECAKLLLEHGAEVNARGGEHNTALHTAAFNGYDQVAALLLENGAEIDPLDEEHRTPLIWVAGEGHPITVKLLLDRGANCMVQDESD
jgi:Ankyrin repeats (3 copies)